MQLVLASTSSFKSNVLKQACVKHIKKDSNYIEVNVNRKRGSRSKNNNDSNRNNSNISR